MGNMGETYNSDLEGQRMFYGRRIRIYPDKRTG